VYQYEKIDWRETRRNCSTVDTTTRDPG